MRYSIMIKSCLNGALLTLIPNHLIGVCGAHLLKSDRSMYLLGVYYTFNVCYRYSNYLIRKKKPSA